MILCFGTFSRALNCCRQGISRSRFVARVAWVIDTKNRCLGAGLDYEIDENALNTIKSLSNPPVASRLLSCKQDFELSSNKEPPVDVAFKRFKSQVMPFIDEDMLAKAVLAILYIISKDETIEAEQKESFRRYLGMYKEELLRQTRFDVPDFLTRVLLYTTCVNNNEGRPYAKGITDAFIEKVVNDSWAALKWDAATQTVEVIPSEERRLFDEINVLSELRHALMTEQVSDTDTSWLGVDKNILFPSRCKRIEFGDPNAKAMLSNKLMQYMKLVHKLTDCLMEQQQSAAGKTATWPIFPDERMQDIRQQIADLSNELFTLGIFSERLNAEQALDSSSLKSE